MATNELYTTPDRVRRLLQRPIAFSSTTNPTDEQVVSLIENKMASLDADTGFSFRLAKAREYRNLDGDYWVQGGARVPLSHIGIITPLSSAAGDSVKVWDGTAWTEMLGTWTEGRAGNFWIDEIEGVFHFITKGLVTNYKILDITYRYNNGARALLNDSDGINTTDTAIVYDNLTGTLPYQGWLTLETEEIRFNATTPTTITAAERGAFNTTAAAHLDNTILFFVPSDIVDCCTMMVALDILNSDDWSSGGMNSGDMPSAQVPIQGKMEEWTKKVNAIIKQRKRKLWSVR